MNRRRFVSMGLSLLILSLALSTLWLGYRFTATEPKQVIVREVALATPPPPPPPPPVVQQQVVETPIRVETQGTGPVLPMADLQQQTIALAKPDMPTVRSSEQAQWQVLEVDWDAFDLNELDGLPTLLSQLRAVFPKSLVRRGIDKVLIKLDVLIDEQGSVTLIDVIENPYPELQNEIRRLVRSSRFSAPQKDGAAVRARFIWPIEIESQT